MSEHSDYTVPDVTFDDIQGTYVFDSRRARIGLAINNMALSLNTAAGREQFSSDPEEYMERYGLNEEQKDAVRRRDWIKMLQLGGNIYFIAKIGILDGLTVQDIDAQMTGVTTEEFVKMLAEGGRKHG